MVSAEHPIEEPVQAFCPHVLNLKKGAEGITRAPDALFRMMALLEHSFRQSEDSDSRPALYQSPITFHQMEPTPNQMTTRMTELMSPSFHQVT
jgi:hypothetical protein